MGHLVFSILHVLAVLGGGVLLWLTVPAHLIYAAIKGNGQAARREEAGQRDMVRCPDCREQVRYDAIRCRHCSVALVPVARPKLHDNGKAQAITVLVVIAVVVLFATMTSK